MQSFPPIDSSFHTTRALLKGLPKIQGQLFRDSRKKEVADKYCTHNPLNCNLNLYIHLRKAIYKNIWHGLLNLDTQITYSTQTKITKYIICFNIVNEILLFVLCNTKLQFDWGWWRETTKGFFYTPL